MLFFAEEKIQNLLKTVKSTIYRQTIPIESFKFAEGDFSNANLPEFDDSSWEDFRVMDYWGGYDVMTWFRATVAIPSDLKDKRLVLRFLVGPRDGGHSTAETLLYVNGHPLQGIDVWHEEAWLPPKFLQDDHIHIALHAWSGVLGVPDRRRFKVAELNQVDETTKEFYFIADTLLLAVHELQERDWRRMAILQGLNQSFQHINFTKTGSDEYYESLKVACTAIKTHVDNLRGQEIHKPIVTAIGHSHIDMAWLWRLRHTRQKAGRTFATVLHLMNQYPEYRFLHSSPQLYEYLEEDYPEIFAQVRERITSGEWEITGGMWIESDVNIPNGESLIRQFLLGKRYIKETFSKETKLLWLPDVFGYSAALPQIIAGCGIDYFMTTKISWSQVNRFPYDTFYWRGIDGTEVLTHFITTPEPSSWFYTYNGQLRPQDVKGIWDAYRQKSSNNNLLLSFGWGDGGGGPTPEMLEQRRVLEDLPGFPKTEIGLAEPYFKRLAASVSDKNLPVWDGELYLEYHRGTYTSQAAIKRANRQSEILFHDAEFLSALAQNVLEQHTYPADSLKQGWKLILLNQFHDILPGSSIRAVYEDSLQDYRRIKSIGEHIRSSAMKNIADNIVTEGVAIFNSLSWQRSELVELPATYAGKTLLQDGLPAPSQITADGSVLVHVDSIPSMGYKAFALVDATPEENTLRVENNLLENQYYRIVLNEQGQITSLFDKEYNREILADGQFANQLIAFEDKPLRFDAWDIDLFYQEKPYPVTHLIETTVEEIGVLRGTLKLVWRFYDSLITQRLSIYAHSRQIDFRTHIDWHEQQVLLKVAFPVNIRNTHASYDIQFGNIERPTHWNTSWDYARFEVAAQKWADLSEANYGVSLMNDCKYGYDIKDHTIRLTLIKSAINPDEQADQGEHNFTYSLLPHGDGWRTANVPHYSYQLNTPLLSHECSGIVGELPESYSFMSVDSNNVIIETVKHAEDEQAWVIRVYENKGSRLHNIQLRVGKTIKKAMRCNLVEEYLEPYSWKANHVTFDINPYEIKTFMLWF